jgi:hypothetical protein
MLNEWLLSLARFLDAQNWSTQIHESIYLYAWIETTHVLTLMVFLGMLFVIDLRMLGLAFPNVRASTIAERLDKPMMIGLVLMVITGVLLYYAIPVRTTQSLWFRIKVVLIVFAAFNAFAFRARMQASVNTWDTDPTPPGIYAWGQPPRYCYGPGSWLPGAPLPTIGLIVTRSCPTPCIGPRAALMKWQHLPVNSFDNPGLGMTHLLTTSLRLRERTF